MRITGPSDNGGIVNISAKVERLPVTEIGESAFQFIPEDYFPEGLHKALTHPNTLKRIENSADYTPPTNMQMKNVEALAETISSRGEIDHKILRPFAVFVENM